MKDSTGSKRYAVTSILLCVAALAAFGFVASQLGRLANNVAQHSSYVRLDARVLWQLVSHLHAADAACSHAATSLADAALAEREMERCLDFLDAARAQIAGEKSREALSSGVNALPLNDLLEFNRIAEREAAAVRAGDSMAALGAARSFHESVSGFLVVATRAESEVWPREAQAQEVALFQAQNYARLLNLMLGFSIVSFLAVLAFLAWRHRTSHRLDRYRDSMMAREKIIVASKEQIDLGIMAAGLAHEINNPLTAILGFSQMLRMSLEQKYVAETRLGDYARRIESQAEKIALITQNLCSIRVAGPNVVLARLDLRVIAGVAVDLVAERFDSLGVALTRDFPTDAAWVRCVDADVFHVVHSLLTNAAEAAIALASGGQPCVWMRIRVDKNCVRLEVEDNGPGIPGDVRDKIFIPFFSTKVVGSGAHGLGLSVASSLVARQGGRIFMDPTRHNTCFVVELDAA